jgi:hypothetical protein
MTPPNLSSFRVRNFFKREYPAKEFIRQISPYHIFTFIDPSETHFDDFRSDYLEYLFRSHMRNSFSLVIMDQYGVDWWKNRGSKTSWPCPFNQFTSLSFTLLYCCLTNCSSYEEASIRALFNQLFNANRLTHVFQHLPVQYFRRMSCPVSVLSQPPRKKELRRSTFSELLT